MDKKIINFITGVVILTAAIVCNVMLYDVQKNMIDHTKSQDALIAKLEKDIRDIEEFNKNMGEHIITLDNTIIEMNNQITELETKIEKLNSEKTTTTSPTKTKSVEQQSTGTTLTFEATAYAGDTITATGTTPVVGRTIAVDPKVIPYGTQVYIEGMGTYTAEDCGGAVKGNIIDIFMATEEECRAWGRRNVQVQILS